MFTIVGEYYSLTKKILLGEAVRVSLLTVAEPEL
jgi:hypothetical protein